MEFHGSTYILSFAQCLIENNQRNMDSDLGVGRAQVLRLMVWLIWESEHRFLENVGREFAT